MKKLGQAALEFLSTYGFAFLIILVMIGALSYFGVLNPGNLLPDRCTGPQGLACEDARAQTDGATDIVVRNQAGNSVTLSNVQANSTYINGASSVSCTVVTASLASGASTQINCPSMSSAFPQAGDKARFSVTGTLSSPTSTFDSPFTIEVIETVQ